MTLHRLSPRNAVPHNLGHLVAVDEHDCRYGKTWQPVCLDCDYRGPFVAKGRALDIADEHTAKSADTWTAAR
jgi:hypothetical protein